MGPPVTWNRFRQRSRFAFNNRRRQGDIHMADDRDEPEREQYDHR